MDLSEKKIVFIDLDGTLIETVSGEKFPKDCTDFRIRKRVVDRLMDMPELEYVVIVTNQGGVPEFVSHHDFNAKASAICNFLASYLNPNPDETLVYVDIIACFSRDDNDPMRKPNPGMIETWINRKLQFATARLKSKSKMLMIGDASGKDGDFSDTDRKCAENFGIDYLDVEDFITQKESNV